MTSVEKKLVCIICLKRFDIENIPVAVPKKHSSCQTTLTTVSRNLQQDEKDKTTCDFDGSVNLYERFLRFVTQYFKLRNFTGRFIACAKEAKSEDGGPAKLDTFCENCGELVKEICDLYRQLQTAQLFLVWKLGQVGELMKKGSVAGPKSRRSYKVTSALSSTIMKQMSVNDSRPVAAFRKALQLKCINAKRKVLPDVVVQEGLSPDQWKFTYTATKQTLIRLITVFLLASSQILKSNHIQPGKNDDAGQGQGTENKRSYRMSRKRMKFSPTVMAAENELDDDHCQKYEDGYNMVDNFGNGSDSDWSQGVACPITIKKAETYQKRKPKWKAKPKSRRNVVVIAEEDGGRDSIDEKTFKPRRSTKQYYPQRPQPVGDPKHAQMLQRSYLHCFKRAMASRRAHIPSNAKPIHALAKPSACKKCFLVIPTRREMRLHMKAVHNSGSDVPVVKAIAKLECPYCFQRMVTEKWFRIHIEIHENKAVNELSHWFCEVCGQQKNSEDSLNVHMKEDHQDKFVCSVCNEVLENGNLLRDHLSINHETEEKPFCCQICRTRFSTKQFHDIHRTLVHRNKRKFACDFKTCDLFFNSIVEMSEHLKLHLDDCKPELEFGIFRCETCKMGFLKKYSLTLHQLLHTLESSTGTGYDCPKCNKNTNCKESLIIHYKFVHGQFDRLEKRHQCKICEKRFSNKVWLNTHVRLHDVTLFEDTFICEICDVRCVDSIALTAHCQRHHEGPNLSKEQIDPGNGMVVLKGLSKMKKGIRKQIWMNKSDTETRYDPASPSPTGKISKKTIFTDDIFMKFPCNVENCGENSESAYLLRKHLENEHEADKPENEKNIQCYHCHKRFVYEQSRELHERAVHKKKITVKLKCDLETCRINKCFYPVEELNEHLKSHLGGEPETSSFKQISFCGKCNWGFMRPEVRDLHELVHIPPRKDGKLRCPSCEGLFNPFCALRCHYNRVHGVNLNLKPNKCGKCDSAFFTKHALRKHFLTTHLGIKLNRGKDNRSRKVKVTSIVTGMTEDKPLENYRTQLDEQFTCDVPECGKIFKNNKALRCHKKVKHGKKEWICEVCGYAFVHKCKLMDHMNTHSDDKHKLACDECGQKFTRQNSLNDHKESKHNPNRIQNSICATCGKSFFTTGGLRMHFESTHKPESEWRLKCPRCPRRFYRRMLLNLHLKTCDGKGRKVRITKNFGGGGSKSTSNELERRLTRGRKKRNSSDEDEITDKSTTEDEMEEDKHEFKPSSASRMSQPVAQNGLPFQQQPLVLHQLQHGPQTMETGTSLGIPSLPGPQQALSTLSLVQHPQMQYCLQPSVSQDAPTRAFFQQRHRHPEQHDIVDDSPKPAYQSTTFPLQVFNIDCKKTLK